MVILNRILDHVESVLDYVESDFGSRGIRFRVTVFHTHFANLKFSTSLYTPTYPIFTVLRTIRDKKVVKFESFSQ